MNMPVNTPPKHNTHPMIITAGIAVVLFCATGTAAIMGWIPASIGSNAGNSSMAQPDQPAASAGQIPQTMPRQASAAPVHRTRTEPSHATATPVKALCSNCGIVESTREIATRAQGSGVGAAGGAVVGGLLGNQIGGGRGKDVMTVVGAIGGAVAGNQIEGQIKATHSYEITVRLEDGSTRSIQQADQPGWRTGDHVKIVDGAVRSNG
ncbi:MAG: surface antigen family protein [Herminiimonas sp.]|nr:surface antigen family protein [Herminiimonas sp.]